MNSALCPLYKNFFPIVMENFQKHLEALNKGHSMHFKYHLRSFLNCCTDKTKEDAEAFLKDAAVSFEGRKEKMESSVCYYKKTSVHNLSRTALHLASLRLTPSSLIWKLHEVFQ